MRLEPRRKVELPFWGLSLLIASTGLGWLVASFLFGQLGGIAPPLVSSFAMDIFKAIFIGSSAGIGINLYLKHALGETPKAVFERSGIDEVYTSDGDRSPRQSAASDFQRLIKNKRIKKIDIIGASLRDFLIPAGNLHQLWQAMVQRLESEKLSALPENDRLCVRLLLLDPRSGEGRFRHSVERSTISALGLPAHVPLGLAAVYGVQQGIPQEFLQVRVYEHCPFAFMFITDTEAFVQQYDYRDHTKTSVLPLIKYLKETSQYEEVTHSFDTIWEYANPEKWNEHHVGTGAAIEEARIRNIFRKEYRGSLSERQIECIDSARPGGMVDILAKPGGTIDILAITGNFYVSNSRVFHTLRRVAEKQDGKDGVPVRFAILNPVSQQAILRAVADSSPAEEIGKTLQSWSWARHTTSRLYQDAHHTMRPISHWKEQGCNFELRLYSSSLACALLLTPNAAFIEQYVYGRSERSTKGLALGGEYPVFEYAIPEAKGEEMIEPEIFASTFKVIWSFYSISLEEYQSKNHEEEFNRNLARLLEELNLKKPDEAAYAR